jgi:1,4-alpha-glucan branching enzyme
MNANLRVTDDRLGIDPAAVQALSTGQVGDPFALLGPHRVQGGCIVRAYQPGAVAVEALASGGEVLAQLTAVRPPGLFAAIIPQDVSYRWRIRWPGGVVQETEDPYSYGLLLGEVDIYLIAEGRHFEIGRVFGAQAMSIAGVSGVRFAVWAPNARRVSVVGDFNGWDGRRHVMRKRVEAGVWELFVPRLSPGAVYKYEILGPNGLLPLKADPVALQAQAPPETASVVSSPQPFVWQDRAWLERRSQTHQYAHAPLSIYEVHAASWRRAGSEQRSLHWDELAEQLISYVSALNFTHIEFLPLMSHPFGGSWGYQPLGLFAPQASLGEPAGFARFVDRCHQANIGVILDWVPAHFPTDPHGLAHFDGTPLYEHTDPREGFHQDWNTLIYNLGRREVHSFLIASALHWLERYHIDGLRVDAVASMLYRDYSRRQGEWIPNRYGGRENLESIDFLRDLNDVVAHRCPGALTIAEESTAWPGVTRSIQSGGLGFPYKWNMGWMHDSLRYLSLDPIDRSHAHDALTFGLVYAFSERFVLPLSHDEVVHGKRSLIGRMPGDRWQRFANLRAYYGFMWAHPGKKLMFMGCEFAQEREWNHDAQLDWSALEDCLHLGVQRLIGDLNRAYVTEPALHALDSDSAGFHWIVGDDRANSVYVFYRAGMADAPPVIAVCNFTPVPRLKYRIGAPRKGRWRELINTDGAAYGGSNMGNGGAVFATDRRCHGQPFSIELTVPPLATLLLRFDESMNTFEPVSTR